MVQALTDRLAEAFAERMHERVRKEFWGYVPEETLDNDALIAEKYQGIRPALATPPARITPKRPRCSGCSMPPKTRG